LPEAVLTHGAGAQASPRLQHHFDTMAQQKEAAVIGMWVFPALCILLRPKHQSQPEAPAVPTWATCPTPWTALESTTGTVGAVCYDVHSRPLRIVRFTEPQR